MKRTLTPTILALLFAAPIYAQEPLTPPARPVVELLEVMPKQIAPTQQETEQAEPLPEVTFQEISASLQNPNCGFPSVKERSTAVNANIFGAVPKTNGVLPANMPLGVPFDGPVLGTEYIRISNTNGNGGHYYSTVQAWNSDMTKIMIGDGGFDDNRLLDTTDNYSLLPQRIGLSTDRVWSNVDPDIIYGITGKSTVYKLNVANGEKTAIYSRPDNAEISFMGKPNIPDDDSKMVFLVRGENRLVTIDLQSTAIPRPVLGELDFTPWANLNQSGISINFEHSGRWVGIASRTKSDGLIRISPDLTKVEKLGTGERCCHSDAAFNTSGESVQAETIWKSRVRVHNWDTKSSYDSPQIINKTDGQSDYWFASYVSGRGQKQCGYGWVLLSGEEGSGSPNHPLALYKIDGNENTPTFKVLGGDLHSGEAKPNQSSNMGKQKAVQSPDGNAVLFDSDGGVAGGELSTYILREKK